MRTAVQHAATALYRRALALVRRSHPEGSRDQAAAVFDALQHDAYRTDGWTGLVRCWLAEAASLTGLLTSRTEAGRAGADGSARAGRGRPMAFFMQDLRDATRSLRRTPAYTLLVVGILALGIGVNTAIFSVVDALLFKPLPYADPDRLVFVSEAPKTGGNFTVAPAAYVYYKAHLKSFDYFEARIAASYVLLGGGEPEAVAAARVSPGYFDLLGVRAAQGRTFAAEDGQPAEPCRAVISHRLWVSRFGGLDSALGRDVTMSGLSCTVIGVLPPETVFDRSSYDMYVPLVFGPQEAGSFGHVLTVVARIARGVSLDQARAEVATVASAFNDASGLASYRDWTGVTVPWRDRLVRADARQLIGVLFAAVSVVLLVSCVNVANLALARTTARRREIAIRTALGASRWRVFRSLVTESIMLAVLGGALGIVIGSWSLRGFLSWLPPGTLPAEAVASLDGRTLLFTLGLSIVTGILFGAMPAWHATKAGSTREMASGSRSVTASRMTARLRGSLLVAEVALAMMLVTGATLLVTSFVRLTGVDPGFSPQRVLTMRVALPATRYTSDAAVIGFFDQALDEIRRIPSVAHAGAVTSLPLAGWLFGTTFSVYGLPPASPLPSAHEQHVTDDYFEALGIPVVAGRTFTRHDDQRSPLVAIVNNTFARRYIPDAAVVGRRLRVGSDATINGQPNSWEIVGLIADVKTGGLADADLATPEIYLPVAQSPISTLSVAVRATSDTPMALSADVRAALRRVDPEIPPGTPMLMTDRIGTSVTGVRFRTGMVSAFAILAGLLACLGVYAVSAQAAEGRVREMGIRLALGARPGQVVGLILRQGLTLVAIGLLAGLIASLELVHFIQRWLFATQPGDPLVLSVAAAAHGASALGASWVPARRAGRVDPLTPLRSE